MLEIVPESWLRWNFDIIENGRPAAQIKMPPLRERADIAVDGSSYLAYRKGMFSGEFILEKDGQSIVQARKPSALFNSFEVEYLGRAFVLKKDSFLSRSFVLLENDREAGSIKAKGPLTRKAEVALPNELPLPVRVFLIWLVLLIWKREAESGGGT